MKPETLTVALAERSYPIHFEGSPAALRAEVNSLREAGRAVRLLSDARVLEAQPEYLGQAGFEDHEILSLPAGEPTKSVSTYAEALGFLAQHSINRDGAVFAFGGGVIGDLAGYVAASYLRGVDFYQIPTTLLAMVDSSVGGKTGLNLPEGKNLVGAFWQPRAVYIDTALLGSLPAREFAAGMAEVVKYGMLADAELFARLESIEPLSPDSPQLADIIRQCCSIKAAIVAADEKETAGNGGRALLNLGHTFAHAIENVAGYGDYLHGEAVAIGLVLASRLSEDLGRIRSEVTKRVVRILEKQKLPTRLRTELSIEKLMEAMQRDKKTKGGKLRFVILNRLGEAATVEGVDPAMVRSIWETAM